MLRTVFLRSLLIVAIGLMGTTMPAAGMASMIPAADAPPCHQETADSQPGADKPVCPMTCCQTIAKDWILLPAAKIFQHTPASTLSVFISHTVAPPTAPPR